MRKNRSNVCKLRLCLATESTNSARMHTIVTAALQRQYSQTELTFWIPYVDSVSNVLVVGCTYKQNTDTIYITRKIKNKSPQVTANTISNREEKGTDDLSHKPQHNSATSKTKCALCADDKISQDAQKFTNKGTFHTAILNASWVTNKAVMSGVVLT